MWLRLTNALVSKANQLAYYSRTGKKLKGDVSKDSLFTCYHCLLSHRFGSCMYTWRVFSWISYVYPGLRYDIIERFFIFNFKRRPEPESQYCTGKIALLHRNTPVNRCNSVFFLVPWICVYMLCSLTRDPSLWASITIPQHRIYSDIRHRGYTENYCSQWMEIFSAPLERIWLCHCHIVNCGWVKKLSWTDF